VVAISPDDGSAIDLRNPTLAAVLSWLVPGLGQIYQGRRLKGWLFLLTLLGTWLAGMWLSGGHATYWLWRAGERRWAFFCQAGIGCAALPAVGQALLLHGGGRQPFAASELFAPPLARGQLVSAAYAERIARNDPLIEPDDFRPQPPWRQFRPLPPPGTLDTRPADQFSVWHQRLGRFFDIGTLYTMLAGMLNMLVVYDAWSGPMRLPNDRRPDDTEPSPR